MLDTKRNSDEIFITYEVAVGQFPTMNLEP